MVLHRIKLDLFYDRKRDYDAEMRAIEAKGNLTADDYKQLASLETERNAKIDALNAEGGGTNQYGATKTSKYLNVDTGNTGKYTGTGSGTLYNADKSYDYESTLKDLMSSGSTDINTLQNTLNQRVAKALSNPGLEQYAYDQTYQDAMNYIDQVKRQQVMGDWQSMADEIMSRIDDMYVAPQMQSDWDDTKNKLAEAALNMNYEDWLNSDQYAALAKRYGLEGRQSMQNTLGQITSRTGGLASSYAQTVAQQAYNDYMAQLESAAYDMYGNEKQNALQNAQAAYDFADSDYQRYLNDMAQYNNNRSYGLQVISDALANSRYAQEWQNTLAQQQLANDRYNQEYADSRADQEYNQQLRAAETLAGYGDFSGYEALGYTPDQIAGMQAAYQQSLVPKGGYRRSSDNSDDEGEDAQNYEGLFRAAMESGYPKSFIKNNYKKYGFSSGTGLDTDYDTWYSEYQDGRKETQYIDDVTFDNAMTMMNEYLNKGQPDRAQGIASDYYSRMTSAQRKQFEKILRAFGIEYEE